MVDVGVGVDDCDDRLVADVFAEHGQTLAAPSTLDMQSTITSPSSPSMTVRLAMSLLRAW